MNIKKISIQKKNDFEKKLKLINSIFNINQNLPNQVFKKVFSDFVFEEFDWTMSTEFWDSCLKPLALSSQDSHILVAVLNPDPVNYFYQTFGYYNWLNIPTNTTGNDYWNALKTSPKDNPADSILFNSEIVAWIPTSGKWAIWGDRSYGICILAFADEQTQSSSISLTKTWKPIDKALKHFIAVNFKNQKIPQDIIDSFILNYAK